MSRMMDGLAAHLKNGDWSFQMWFRTRKGGGIAYDKLAKEIRRQVATRTSAEHEEGFEFTWQHLTIQLRESRKPSSGGLGKVNVFSCGWLNEVIESVPAVDRIRRVLSDKAKHYGPIAQPFIVVMGMDSHFDVGEHELLDALLGRRQLTFIRKQDGTQESQWGRDVDGFFGFPGKPKNRRLSGVLFVGNWTMTTLAVNFINRDLLYPEGWGCYVTNPFATHPVLDPFPDLPRILLSDVGKDSVMQDGRPGRPIVPFLLS
jgi:hypothetical protein